MSPSEEEPVTPFSFARTPTTCADLSYTTHSCPCTANRFTMLAPILPRPTIPSCIDRSSSNSLLMRSTSRWCLTPMTAQIEELLVFSVPLDQACRGSIMCQCRLCRALQFANNTLRQHLAQLNAPLIKRVDTPDRSLSKYRMFIESDQLTQHLRRQLLRKDRVRRPIPLKHTMRNQPIRRSFRLHLLR